MSEYFSHDTNARNDMKCAKLIKVLGYKGYGVFWAVIELMNEQSDCQLPTDFVQLGWQLHINAKVLERVVREFGLFRFSEDGCFFWSTSARRRLAMRQEKKKRGRPAKNAGNSFPEKPRETDYTCENRAETHETRQNDVSVGVVDMVNDSDDARRHETTTQEERADDPTQDGEDGDRPNEAEQIVSEWNRIFKGTPQECRWGGVFPPAVWHDWTEAKKLGYALKDLFTAFQVARTDDWPWQLKDVVKDGNIQRLLTKKAKNGGAKHDGGGNLDFMEGKQYFDADGNPTPQGGEFVSPEFWDDLKANNAIAF